MADGRKAALDVRREMDRSTLQAELDAKEAAREALALELYEDEFAVVPLSEVSFVEKRYEARPDYAPTAENQQLPPEPVLSGLEVVMTSSTWNHEHDCWDGSLWVDAARADAFLAAFRKYRGWLHERAAVGTLLVGTREEVAGS